MKPPAASQLLVRSWGLRCALQSRKTFVFKAGLWFVSLMGMWRRGHSEPFISLTQWWMCAALCPMAELLSKPLSYQNACSFLLGTSRENSHVALFTAFHGCHTSLINFNEEKYFDALLVIEWSMNLHEQQIWLHIIPFFSESCIVFVIKYSTLNDELLFYIH